ncbi:MAG: hypothetical protein J1F24_07490 [Oscillospiraceae bacterium]|nr:hypothetical protein [Oscillospiraceae bacterium]
MNSTFLINPNLPSNDVTDLLVSDGDNSLISALADLGINSLKMRQSPNLDPFCANHSDILVYHLGNGRFIVDETAVNAFESDNVIGIVNVCSPYPNDCMLNAADIGDYIICNSKITHKSILKSAEEQNKQIINVNQGYAKCSVCIVKRNTVITDDMSIYQECEKKDGISVLLVSKGSVVLHGQNYGFLGGASGLIGENKLFFNGDLTYHKDFLAIMQFLSYHNVKYTDIKNKPLTDVGSIIPIKQKGNTE